MEEGDSRSAYARQPGVFWELYLGGPVMDAATARRDSGLLLLLASRTGWELSGRSSVVLVRAAEVVSAASAVVRMGVVGMVLGGVAPVVGRRQSVSASPSAGRPLETEGQGGLTRIGPWEP